MPAMGALKAADNPALAPQVMRSFSSVFTRLAALEKPFAVMAPSWMLGPSRPRDNPHPRDIMPPPSLASSTRHHVSSISPMISPSIWGMPLPDIRESHLRRRDTTHAATARIRIHTGTNQVWLLP